ncbi:hypothetical protein AL036_02720 [Salipiger aestuarii]|nr:hypothetical protein AL036_02720 [Salipiger aestuarii]KAA8612933.1 hypothetical protein AL037_06305 [Salipiger aestuarii]KAB2543713.1 hypothetical protein AL035_00645 [Salipiger aestuarii]
MKTVMFQGMTPKPRRKEDRRHRILSDASGLFACNGHAATNIELIAAAGVNHVTARNYHGTKAGGCWAPWPTAPHSVSPRLKRLCRGERSR